MRVSEWIARHPGAAVTVTPDDALESLLDRILGGPCLRDLYVADEQGRLVGHLS